MIRRRVIVGLLLVAAVLVFLYVLLPRIAGLGSTWERVRSGEPAWLAIAGAMEVLSFAGYIALFRSIFAGRLPRIGWRESYLITLAGVAATRLLATAGAGGIALTAWALRRAGMERREVGASMTTFMVLLYGVFFAAMLLCGIGLSTGILSGRDTDAVTIVPAVLAGAVIVLALSASLVPRDLESRWRGRPHWWAEWLLVRFGAVAGIVSSGVRGAVAQVRSRRPGTAGAVAWWGFDIATLWASFHAFGNSPPGGVIVMGYLVGQLGNTLPLPGGIGGVEGGMVGAFALLGVNAGLALVAVLTYRAFAFWLPTVPGVLAYLRLHRIVGRWGQEDAPGSLTAGADVAAPAGGPQVRSDRRASGA
jgi:uncharacterized membrane protein YbhN (UPF0104 family)